jgi:O-acetyl-ADP-ribose deacetylase (regulator of RNase III)
MFRQADQQQIKKISMPRIGCGLDGLEWDRVKELIKSHQSTIDVLVIYL